jgi:hypothetical protein
MDPAREALPGDVHAHHQVEGLLVDAVVTVAHDRAGQAGADVEELADARPGGQVVDRAIDATLVSICGRWPA